MTKLITLYTLGTPNGVKVSIALELLHLTYKTVTIDITTGEQKKPQFTAINPNGRIPALTVEDQETKKVTNLMESGAILLYLADQFDHEHKISYPHGSPEYYQTIQWLFFQNAGIGPMQGQANHFQVFASEKIPYAIERYLTETKRLYTVLSKQIESNPSGFIVGDHISIADISTVGWVSGSGWLGDKLNLEKEFPVLKAWVDKLRRIEEVQKGLDVPVPWRF
ncbi:glutathione S-transferase [Nadsonia fulvescens var. elongata DSM 6958]|uniref:Glutathione S-transferase n=1 Tax=Nadsonia fulvescens var. elongata DSM 6958 TaxID=857566 RepID=A0A1E3PRA8_9ASCO|nr:glutathione S-transferase [Nadsonia fulvescens var. elongata DSM 6958]